MWLKINICKACLIGLLGMYIFIGTSEAQRRIAEEALIFQELRDGVFTVYGDEGHGSGFLIDSSGIILTNQHVVANSMHLRVQINDSTTIPAVVLLEDAKKDIAALRVHSDFVRNCPILKLRYDTVDFAMEGEKVLAIGSPLNQSRILTSGIISKVEPDVIISDVNINHGNSGGPLINLDKEVIGLNTFGDFSEEGGPGISGVIRIDKFFKFIDSAIIIAKELALPAAHRLPIMPKEPYPLAALEQIPLDSKLNTKYYKLSKGKFNIEILTPPFNYWRDKQNEVRLAKNRQKREKKGQAQNTETYNLQGDLKDWYQYVGEYSPVVIIEVIPKIGEKGSSIFGNLLGAMAAGATKSAYYARHKMEFKGDLKDLTLLCNGEPVEEIRRGMSFIPLDFFQATWGASYQGEDLARAGLFMFRQEVFQPIDSVWPSISIVTTRIDKPNKPDTLKVPLNTIMRVWNDFKPYREQLESKNKNKQ